MILVKKYLLRITLIILSIMFLVGCDQTTKKAAHIHLKDKDHQEIAGIINLQYVENDGGMLSLGSKLSAEIKFIIFVVIVSTFLLLLFLYVIKNKQEMLLKQSALILILSGGLGNLFDRIFNDGNVVDFIRIKLPIIESGIFNVADFYVTTGFILLLISSFVKTKRKKNLSEII